VLNREKQADFVAAATYIGGSAREVGNMSCSVLLTVIAQFGMVKVLKLLTVNLVVFGWNTGRKTPLLLLRRPSYEISLSFPSTSVIFLITSFCSYLILS
jgi:hypothetical protein